MSTYQVKDDTLWANEFHLYGSSRLGITRVNNLYWVKAAARPASEYRHCVGCKQYEITNHLGNVMTVINDRKTPVPKASPNEDEAEYFMPTVLMQMDYYPFGMQMFDPTTLTLAGEYRFGFNTQEKVDEIKGAGNHYTAKYWEYDPRVVHRWNVDPRANPAMSPYAILGGNPIWFTDFLGDSINPMASARTGIPHALKTVYWDPTIGAALNFFGKIATGGVMYFCSTCGGEETRNAKDGGNVEYGPNIDNLLTKPDPKEIRGENHNVPEVLQTTKIEAYPKLEENPDHPAFPNRDTVIDESGRLHERSHSERRDGSRLPIHPVTKPID